MSYSIEMLPGEPILIQVWHEDWSFKDDREAVFADARDILDQQSEPVYFITDMRDVRLKIVDVIAGANSAGPTGKDLFNHSNIKQITFVTNDKLIRLSAKGMASEAFGNIHIKVFETAEDALAFARNSA